MSTTSVQRGYSLVLKIRNVVEAIKEMTLRPGESQKAAFIVIKDKPGVYDVDLEGLKGNFVVSAVPLSRPPVVPEPVAEKEAKLAAKEKARKEAEEARKAREAEKQAQKEAKLAAKEKVRKAKGARKRPS